MGVSLRVNVETRGIARAKRLAKRLSISHPEALGRMVLLWASSQDEEQIFSNGDDIAFWFDPDGDFKEQDVIEALLQCGFIVLDQKTGKYDIRGNSQHVELLKKLRSAAKKGGESNKRRLEALRLSSRQAIPKPNAKPNTIQYNSNQSNAMQYSSKNDSPSQDELLPPGVSGETLAAPKKKKTQALGAQTWEAYRQSYFSRYGVDPVRNATVSSQIAAFVKRVGKDAAPEVAKFYLTHPKGYYVANQHPVAAMLKDAEALHTQWKTNRRVTGKESFQNERTEGMRNQLERIRKGEL